MSERRGGPSRGTSRTVLLLLVSLAPFASPFAPLSPALFPSSGCAAPGPFSTRSAPPGLSGHLPLLEMDMPTLLTAVDTFDGSQIVDPVVVSNAFWGGLKGKIISVIIGQLLATIAFTALTSAVASQLPKIGETVGGLFGDGKARSEAADFAAKSVEVSMEKGSQARESGVSPDFGKLLLCILIDIVGTSSELLPVLGEVTDVAWAPVAALGLRSLFQSNTVFALEFAEEILPFTDVVPLATICWA